MYPAVLLLYSVRMGISSAAGGQMEAFGAVWIEPSTWIYLITLFYTIPDMGLAYCVSQQITCIFLGIFMAYVYMRTENIWVPVAVHFLNNNLIPVFAGNYTGICSGAGDSLGRSDTGAASEPCDFWLVPFFETIPCRERPINFRVLIEFR